MTESRPAVGTPPEAGPRGTNGNRGQSRARSGLVARIALGVGGLAAGLTIVFALLLIAIVGLRHRSNEARRSQEVIATANGLQTLLIDFETGLRGFVIWKEQRYLDPWRRAQKDYPSEMDKLIRLTEHDPHQQAAAREIKTAIDAYLNDYSLPLVDFLQRNPAKARPVAASSTGSQKVQAIRQRFRRFLADEEALGGARDSRARTTARNALLVGLIALAGALFFLIAAAVYLGRVVAHPVRLVARAAQRVAAGDLSGRLPTEGPGEIGILERSFNAMADSLQRSRDDLEERNRRLVESEHLKTELVSNVSHELRTPLTSVLGFSDLMLKRDVEPDERRRYLEVIRSESGRLATLLNDLLDLQRQELGVLELRSEEFDLNELLRVQITLYSAQSEVHELSFEPAPEPLFVYGDSDRLAQVVGNILSNAIKYSPDGGKVDVTAASIRDDAWVWVRDFGLGIPNDQQKQLFTKFFRGDAARARGIRGTGLGLVLARQILQAHGGEIGFESEEGRGSTFWIRLPTMGAAKSSSAAGDGAEARQGM
ncbi:MAG: HAMP domain-containing protein [Actinobacteria bacterium]|nr:MAG: HAMP domain-containing protein [Actinomycetota bacterium]